MAGQLDDGMAEETLAEWSVLIPLTHSTEPQRNPNPQPDPNPIPIPNLNPNPNPNPNPNQVQHRMLAEAAQGRAIGVHSARRGPNPNPNI